MNHNRFDSDVLEDPVTTNPTSKARELGEKFNVSQATVLDELKRSGSISVVRKCFSHDLSRQ